MDGVSGATEYLKQSGGLLLTFEVICWIQFSLPPFFFISMGITFPPRTMALSLPNAMAL